MPEPSLRLLLDEHYPRAVAESLCGRGIDSEAVVARPDLLGADDTTVLRTAMREGRVVVTEDVTTFSIAISAIPNHAGVVYCHHSRFPRTPAGLDRLHRALMRLDNAPPPGLGKPGFVWWLRS